MAEATSNKITIYENSTHLSVGFLEAYSEIWRQFQSNRLLIWRYIKRDFVASGFWKYPVVLAGPLRQISPYLSFPGP